MGLIYLYCVIEAGSAADGLLQGGDVPGIEAGRPLFAVRSGKLVAAVSRVPVEVFDEEPLSHLMSDLAGLAPYAVRHEQAIRMLFGAARALLPMTFGAIYRSVDGVSEMLAAQDAELRRGLERVRNHQEWEVKLLRRPAELRAAAAARQAGPSEADQVGVGPGRAYLLKRLRERSLGVEATRLGDEIVRSIYDRAAAASSAVRLETIEAAGTADAELLCRLSALVPNGAASNAFCALVGELNREYGPLGISLELTGPWAPYSFVSPDHHVA